MFVYTEEKLFFCLAQVPDVKWEVVLEDSLCVCLQTLCIVGKIYQPPSISLPTAGREKLCLVHDSVSPRSRFGGCLCFADCG